MPRSSVETDNSTPIDAGTESGTPNEDPGAASFERPTSKQDEAVEMSQEIRKAESVDLLRKINTAPGPRKCKKRVMWVLSSVFP
jgi:hypothetical protein